MEDLSSNLPTLLLLLVPIYALAGGLRKRYLIFASSMLTIIAAVILPTAHATLWRAEGSESTAGLWMTVILNGLVVVSSWILSALVAQRSSGLYDDIDNLGGLAALIVDSNIPSILQNASLLDIDQICDALAGCRFRFAYLRKTNSKTKAEYTTYQLIIDTSPPNAQPRPLLSSQPPKRSSGGNVYRDRLKAHPFVLTLHFALVFEALAVLPYALLFGLARQRTLARLPANHSNIDPEKYLVISAVGEWTFDRALVSEKVLLAFVHAVGTSVLHGILNAVCIMAPWSILRRRDRLFYRRAFGSDGRAASRRLITSNYLAEGPFSVIFSTVRGKSFVGFFTVLRYIGALLTGPAISELYLLQTGQYPADLLPECNINVYFKGNVNPCTNSYPDFIRLAMLGLEVWVWIWVTLEAFAWLAAMTYGARILPRLPISIISRIAYLCHSEQLLDDLRDVDVRSMKNINQRLKERSGEGNEGEVWGYSYGLGWVHWLGVDEVRRWELAVERGLLEGRYYFGRLEPDPAVVVMERNEERRKRVHAESNRRKVLETERAAKERREKRRAAYDKARDLESHGRKGITKPDEGQERKEKSWWHYV